MKMSFAQLDYQLFQMVNGLGRTMDVLNPVMRMFASYAEYVFYIGIVIYWFTRHRIQRQMVVQSLVSACVAFACSGIIGHFFYRDRPFVTHAVLQLIEHPANASFPSDHATGAFVIAASIWSFRRKEGLVWLVLAACIAFSRVWTGVHYPSDVLAGAVLGIAAAAVVHQLLTSVPKVQNMLFQVIHWYEVVENKVWKKKLVSEYSTKL
ncbi:undecaprenyl-diphosphatase [Paenibacillus sp. MAH-36]|uniref:Undecaprenyl-diphosphatase n=2 Tax=Paenibacillus TaxID=44249 RepID=A0ABU3RBV9_9BACL|nr:undecaprenyl-diphosphatase [Paenibacillus sp. PFR10]MDU0201741.1 undecaprenyl-diphosphatase [Paenibacillus sp. PFR10]